MLKLPRVTLCCVDTAYHELALRSIKKSIKDIEFGRVLFLTNKEINEPRIEVKLIKDIKNTEEYSQYMIKHLWQHINTSHVLIVQWDSWVRQPESWNNEFLKYDYIGAKWYFHEKGFKVGNGGFSLRSKKLLEALQDPRYKFLPDETEDTDIGVKWKRQLEQSRFKIRFAPESIAEEFAYETQSKIGDPFGFHGLFNFHHEVSDEEMPEIIDLFSDYMLQKPQMLQFLRGLVAKSKWPLVSRLAARMEPLKCFHTEIVALLGYSNRRLAEQNVHGK
jgi:hypothetical protein